MGDKRTPIGKFIHTTWGNLQLRVGRHKHLQKFPKKYSCYEGIELQMTLEDYKAYCYQHKEHILSLDRPSLDRVDSAGHYCIENIQIIELAENLRKDKTVFINGQGTCYACKQVKPEEAFVRDRRRANGRASMCKPCDRERGRDKYQRLYKNRSTGK